MAAGLPLVAPRTGGIPELFADGCEGRFWPLDDVEAGARILVDLLEDDDRLAAMSDAALATFSRRFATDAVGPCWNSSCSKGGPTRDRPRQTRRSPRPRRDERSAPAPPPEGGAWEPRGDPPGVDHDRRPVFLVEFRTSRSESSSRASRGLVVWVRMRWRTQPGWRWPRCTVRSSPSRWRSKVTPVIRSPRSGWAPASPRRYCSVAAPASCSPLRDARCSRSRRRSAPHCSPCRHACRS